MLTNRIVQIIQERYDDSLFGVTELANELNISDSYLREIICMNFGMCPQKLIETIRMEKTIELLAENNKHYHIAKSVGYASTRSFRRAFHKRIGMSPERFKEVIFQKSSETNTRVLYTIHGLWNKK